jgi:hypothetical protein
MIVEPIAESPCPHWRVVPLRQLHGVIRRHMPRSFFGVCEFAHTFRPTASLTLFDSPTSGGWNESRSP